jgi:TfoX/Sxy family transcriptional regulator of competence genes
MMPKANPVTIKAFEALLPPDPRIVVRPMFGHKASFVNGHMFAGTFGPDVFVRLEEGDRADLLAIDGAKPFEPMKGRPMSGYVQLPRRWIGKGAEAKAWVARALARTAGLPPKLRTTRPRRAPAKRPGVTPAPPRRRKTS